MICSTKIRVASLSWFFLRFEYSRVKSTNQTTRSSPKLHHQCEIFRVCSQTFPEQGKNWTRERPLSLTQAKLWKTPTATPAIVLSLYMHLLTTGASLASKGNDKTCTHFHELHGVVRSHVTCEAIRVFKAAKWRISRRFSGWLARCDSLSVFWIVFWGGEAFEIQQITLVINLVELKSDFGKFPSDPVSMKHS